MQDDITGTDEVTGYRLVVPDGWYAIDLEPPGRERSVTALVNRQFAGIDNAPHLKAQARQELLTRAEAAHAAGGVEMFLSLQEISGVPLAASLVIFLVPPAGDQEVTPDDLAWTLTDDGREIAVTDLPAGKAVRMVHRSGSPHDDLAVAPDPDSGPPSLTLEVFAPVPGTGWWLLLSFAAPDGPLAPAMTKLFDAICLTLRWD